MKYLSTFGRYVYPLYEFGKTTLETYLLQHHVWLTSNAKTVSIPAPYRSVSLIRNSTPLGTYGRTLHRAL